MAIRSLSAPDALQTQTYLPTRGSKRRTERLRFALRMVIRSAALSCFAAALTGSGGCSIGKNAGKALMQHDCLDEFMVDYRNRAMAAKAWHCNKQRYCNRGHLDEFQSGFYAGYANIASGGTGCCPTIAPKEYWGWKYQSSDGQAGVNSWFEGFPLGAQAAEMDGIGHWSQIRPAGLPTVVPGSAVGTPTPMQGPVYMEGPGYMDGMGDGALQTPYMSDPIPGAMPGNGMMLETGPQILLNQPSGNSNPTSGSVSGGRIKSEPAVTIAPVNVTSEQVDSTKSLNAVFGSSTGASASIGDATNDELPFSFK